MDYFTDWLLSENAPTIPSSALVDNFDELPEIVRNSVRNNKYGISKYASLLDDPRENPNNVKIGMMVSRDKDGGKNPGYLVSLYLMRNKGLMGKQFVPSEFSAWGGGSNEFDVKISELKKYTPEEKPKLKPKPKEKEGYESGGYKPLKQKTPCEKRFAVDSPDDLLGNRAITFIYLPAGSKAYDDSEPTKEDRLYCTKGGAVHDTGIVQKFPYNPTGMLLRMKGISGRLGSMAECSMISYWGDQYSDSHNPNSPQISKLASYLAYHFPEMMKDLDNVVVKPDNGQVQKIKVTRTPCKGYMWIDPNAKSAQEDGEDVEPGCPDLDYRNTMVKLHTGTAAEKSQLAQKICNLQIDPQKCPKTVQLAQALRGRVNCKVQGQPNLEKDRRDWRLMVKDRRRYERGQYESVAPTYSDMEISFRNFLTEAPMGGPPMPPPGGMGGPPGMPPMPPPPMGGGLGGPPGMPPMGGPPGMPGAPGQQQPKPHIIKGNDVWSTLESIVKGEKPEDSGDNQSQSSNDQNNAVESQPQPQGPPQAQGPQGGPQHLMGVPGM